MSGSRVQPVALRHTSPENRALLTEIQDALGIPWAPANWRAYALCPLAMRLLWERLLPLILSDSFLKESLGITRTVYRDVAGWYQPAADVELTPSDRARIQWELDAFEYGNGQLLLQQ